MFLYLGWCSLLPLLWPLRHPAQHCHGHKTISTYCRISTPTNEYTEWSGNDVVAFRHPFRDGWVHALSRGYCCGVHLRFGTWRSHPDQPNASPSHWPAWFVCGCVGARWEGSRSLGLETLYVATTVGRYRQLPLKARPTTEEALHTFLITHTYCARRIYTPYTHTLRTYQASDA